MENQNQNYVAYLTEGAAKYLYKAGGWSMFLGILGFISTGILFFVSLGFLFGGASAGAALPAGFPVFLVGVTYLFVAVVSFYFSFLLVKFASTIKSSLVSGNEIQIEYSLKYIFNLFLFSGVMAIISLIFYVIAIIAFASGMFVGANMIQG